MGPVKSMGSVKSMYATGACSSTSKRRAAPRGLLINALLQFNPGKSGAEVSLLVSPLSITEHVVDILPVEILSFSCYNGPVAAIGKTERDKTRPLTRDTRHDGDASIAFRPGEWL